MRPPRAGFTLLELAISLAVVCALLVILLPALSTARMSSHRALCAGNQRLLGQAWSMYVEVSGHP
jgi:prepilin-type N-terminal cleavage/methylation domain-containing protein